MKSICSNSFFLQFLKSNILSLQKINEINLYRNQKAKHVISD